MSDPALAVLLPWLQQSGGPVLWVADENALPMVQAVAPRTDLRLLSNRFDVVQAALQTQHQADFSDFDFSCYADGSFRRIVYRISKEKPVVHHVLNGAARLLAIGGELLVAGLKNEGTKTFIDKGRQLFGHGESEKCGTAYLGHFVRQPVTSEALLDEQDYDSLRLLQGGELDFYSKPGLFGWNKIDQGSAFLLEKLPDCLAQLPAPPQALLDLGCGYGYLTLMTRELPLQRRVATDNNAAALRAMAKNAAHYGLAVDVVADDAGASLRERFDLILCNPPFHQGFAVDRHLTEKFLHNIHRLLAPRGAALLVVNVFIGLEQKAASSFSSVTTLASNRSFKLVLLRP